MTGAAPMTIDEVASLDAGLARAAAALDREIAASGAVGRVADRVMARVAPRPPRRAVWVAVAAALVVAAGLGCLADIAWIGGRTGTGREVVVMDPLVFGTTVVDQR